MQQQNLVYYNPILKFILFNNKHRILFYKNIYLLIVNICWK